VMESNGAMKIAAHTMHELGDAPNESEATS